LDFLTQTEPPATEEEKKEIQSHFAYAVLASASISVSYQSLIKIVTAGLGKIGLFYGNRPLNTDLWTINSQISNMNKIRAIVQVLEKRTSHTNTRTHALH
jgi:hypothetical protein